MLEFTRPNPVHVQVGGYAVEYEVGSKGGFVFTTIRGGRHEVRKPKWSQIVAVLIKPATSLRLTLSLAM